MTHGKDLRDFVCGQPRDWRTPDQAVFGTELPTNVTGKVLRRERVTQLKAASKEST